MKGEGKRKEVKIIKGHKETFERDGYVYHLLKKMFIFAFWLHHAACKILVP